MLAGDAVHCLVYGGSRSGKTFLLCYCIAVRMMLAPGSRHIIARLQSVDVRKSVMMDTWPKVMKMFFPQVRCVITKSDQVARFPDIGDSEVWFAGLDDKESVEKILGREYATIYVNESSQVPYSTIMILRTRLAQNVMRTDGRPLKLKAYYDLNPTGKQHWTYREFIEGVRPDNAAIKLKKGSRVFAVINPDENPNLPAAYHAILDEMPEAFRKRFKEGTYIDEVEGSLWPLHVIEQSRVMPGNLPPIVRIVIGVDPSGSDGTGGDSQGIIIGAKCADGHYYILRDLSCKKNPHGWGLVVKDAAVEFDADCIVAEVNYGGAMVEATVMNVGCPVRYKAVTASRGKHIRAEPISALYAQGLVHHCGLFPDLEAQLSMFTTQGYQDTGSPDRADALVWVLTELAGIKPGQGLIDFYTAAGDAAILQAEAVAVQMIRLQGPATIGMIYGNDGRMYEKEYDEAIDAYVFRVHPDDAPLVLGQVGWTVV